MSGYQSAVEMVSNGATYREALASHGLKSMSNLHRLCREAGISPRPRGYKPRPLSEKARHAVSLVHGGMTFRQASEVTGLAISVIHRAVHRKQ